MIYLFLIVFLIGLLIALSYFNMGDDLRNNLCND